MQGVWHNGQLFARQKHGFIPHGQVIAAFTIGNNGANEFGLGAGQINIDFARPAAERFFFARLAINRRVQMFGARLMGKQHQIFGAHAQGIDIGDDFQSSNRQVAESEVGDFNAGGLARRQNDARVGKRGTSAGLGFRDFVRR